MADYIPREQLEHLICTDIDVGVEPAIVQPPQELQSMSLRDVRYDLMPKTSTYAHGVHSLREACDTDSGTAHPMFVRDDGNKIYRPLTFKETLQALVDDYNTTQHQDGTERTAEERLKLFTTTWKNSCTAVAYKGGTSKFKIVPVSKGLIEIAKNFNELSLPVDYDTIVAPELDLSAAKYRTLLTKDEVVDHSAWRAAVENDVPLLREYRDIVFTARGDPSTLMGFWVTPGPSSDYLRALLVINLVNDSDAIGSSYLYYTASFLRGSPTT
jgi:hypothetical protein